MVSMASASGASASGEPRLTAGQTWGPYRIGRLLGRGGMGEVYEAESLETGRRLALKLLRSRLEKADDRARFLREGQLAASISHPHTVYIFGSEEIEGMPVISMELLPGGTLKERVAANGPMPPEEAVAAVMDIIGGLDAAQAAGVLHRDIKPSNCFIDDDGAVKVGDFGLSISTLARDVHHDLETGAFQGTPQFAPPEQLRGEPLDIRADIYAVGATLYYLLTGQPPFDATRSSRTRVARDQRAASVPARLASRNSGGPGRGRAAMSGQGSRRASEVLRGSRRRSSSVLAGRGPAGKAGIALPGRFCRQRHSVCSRFDGAFSHNASRVDRSDGYLCRLWRLAVFTRSYSRVCGGPRWARCSSACECGLRMALVRHGGAS